MFCLPQKWPACRIVLGWLAAVLTAGLTFGRALAHEGDNPIGWSSWSLDPFILLPLLLSVWVYLRGQRAISARSAQNKPVWQFPGRAVLFLAGILLIGAALLSPIDYLAEELFWVHMLQHILLMLVAAPMLTVSRPLPNLLMGLPAWLRQSAGQTWAGSGWIRAAWGFLSQPLSVWIINAAVLWIWHAPAAYQAALENDVIHAFQHLTFLASGLLFWWVAGLRSARWRSAGSGVVILMLFTTMLHSGLLGALLTFSTTPWISVYAALPGRWGLSALEDQQLAGILMWVFGGLVYLGASLWMLRNWIESFAARAEKNI